MSEKHPIISVTGSSGTDTALVRHTFEQIFRREHIIAAFIEGEAFHRYDRREMQQAMDHSANSGNANFSDFGEEANLFEDLETTFRTYGESGTGRFRHYVHDDDEAQLYKSPPGTFTPWTDLPAGADLLFYDGLHGALVTDKVDIARYADLKIGVVPVINLEWTQKIHGEHQSQEASKEDVTNTILRRMPDYVKYICPQFTQTDINFQRIPTVDTSNPFISRWVPLPEESMVVIRFSDPHGIDFPYLLNMMDGAFMSRPNSIVIPGGRLELAMQLILTPLILALVERKRRLFHP